MHRQTDNKKREEAGDALYGSHMYLIVQAGLVKGKPMFLIRNVHNRRASNVRMAFTQDTKGALKSAPKLGQQEGERDDQPEFKISLKTFRQFFKYVLVSESLHSSVV